MNLKCKILITLIFWIFLAHCACAPPNHVLGSEAILKTCQIQTEAEMKQMLIKMYQMNMQEIINGIEYNPKAQSDFNKSIIKIEISSVNTTMKVYGNKECSRLAQRTQIDQDSFSTCPYHFIQVNRTDIYPFSRLHSICNCKNCLFSEDISQMGCRPIYLTLPALRREGCNSNGTYEWRGVLERVSIGCSCALLDRL